MKDIKQLVETVAAEADATADEAMPAGVRPTRPNRTVTVATRLTVADADAVEKMAAQLDVPVSALLRGWIMAGLTASRDETVGSAIDRLSADVQRLRQLVA